VNEGAVEVHREIASWDPDVHAHREITRVFHRGGFHREGFSQGDQEITEFSSLLDSRGDQKVGRIHKGDRHVLRHGSCALTVSRRIVSGRSGDQRVLRFGSDPPGDQEVGRIHNGDRKFATRILRTHRERDFYR
jgi:hypothetical protein